MRPASPLPRWHGNRHCYEASQQPPPAARSARQRTDAQRDRAIFAAVSAFFSVRFLVKYFETQSLKPFAIYCVAAGVIALVLVSI